MIKPFEGHVWAFKIYKYHPEDGDQEKLANIDKKLHLRIKLVFFFNIIIIIVEFATEWTMNVYEL